MSEAERLLREMVRDGWMQFDHSWRCEHPQVYGPCDCVARAIEAFTEKLAIHDRHVTAEAWNEGVGHAAGNACLFASGGDPCPQNPYREENTDG